VELAKEHGPYPFYQGSTWSQGILPVDTYHDLMARRSGETDKVAVHYDWDMLREKILKHGIRNSCLMAIAPTASISNISGVSSSFEPTYQNVYALDNIGGIFTKVNKYLAEDLSAIGLWDMDMVEAIRNNNGSIQNIGIIPNNIKKKYKIAFELDPMKMINNAAKRQIWVDQGQSLNIYIKNAEGRDLHNTYTHAWEKGLKTTYYLRTASSDSNHDETGNIELPAAEVLTKDDCVSCQ